MSTSQSLVLGTAARQLSVGYKIVALLIVGEGQIRARTSKWNKLTLIWIRKSEISEICSYESLPVRTAAAAGRRNSSRPVHNSSFHFQSILQDRENATLGHMTPLKGLRNVLGDTLLHRISIVLQWSQVKQYKTYQCTLRDTHSLMNKDVLKIVIKHVTPDMLHVTAGCFYQPLHWECQRPTKLLTRHESHLQTIRLTSHRFGLAS